MHEKGRIFWLLIVCGLCTKGRKASQAGDSTFVEDTEMSDLPPRFTNPQDPVFFERHKSGSNRRWGIGERDRGK